jgi:hypothetical protein
VHNGSVDVPVLVCNADPLATPGVTGFPGHQVMCGDAPDSLSKGDKYACVIQINTTSARATSVVICSDIDEVGLVRGSYRASGWRVCNRGRRNRA